MDGGSWDGQRDFDMCNVGAPVPSAPPLSGTVASNNTSALGGASQAPFEPVKSVAQTTGLGGAGGQAIGGGPSGALGGAGLVDLQSVIASLNEIVGKLSQMLGGGAVGAAGGGPVPADKGIKQVSQEPPTGLGGAVSKLPDTGLGGAVSKLPETGLGGAVSKGPETGLGGASDPTQLPTGLGGAVSKGPETGLGGAVSKFPPLGGPEGIDATTAALPGGPGTAIAGASMMGDPAFAGVLESLMSVLTGLTTMMGSMTQSTPPNGGPSVGQMPVGKFDPVQQTPVDQFPPGQFPPRGGPGNSDFGHSHGNDQNSHRSV